MRLPTAQGAEGLVLCTIMVFSILSQCGVLAGTQTGTSRQQRAMTESDQISGNRTGRSLQGLLGFLAGFRLGHSLTSAVYGTGLNEIPNYSAFYDYLPYAPVYSSQHIILPHLPLVYPVGMRPSTLSPLDLQQEISVNETQKQDIFQNSTKKHNNKNEEIITNKLLPLGNSKNHPIIDTSLSDAVHSMTDRIDISQIDDSEANVKSTNDTADENTTAVSLEINESKLLELRADNNKTENDSSITTSTIITTTMDNPTETGTSIDTTPSYVPPFSNSNFTWSYYPYYGKPTGNENISITTDSTNDIQDMDFSTFAKYLNSLSPPLTNSIDNNIFSKPVKTNGFSPVLSDFFNERNYVRGSYNYLRNQVHDKSRVYWG